MSSRGPRAILLAAALVAILFGLATVFSGGKALFSGASAKVAAGNVVDLVLWFNFIAGFAYVLAGGGLLLRRRWAVGLSLLIAVATVVVFAAFAVHVLTGGPYEMRTVGAMALRSVVWIVIAGVASGGLGQRVASRA